MTTLKEPLKISWTCVWFISNENENYTHRFNVLVAFVLQLRSGDLFVVVTYS